MTLRLLLALGLATGSLMFAGCSTSPDDDDSSDDDDSAGDDDDSVGGVDCSGAVAITCGASMNGTTVGGTNQASAWACTDFDTTGPETFYRFAAATSEPVTVRMTPTTEDLDLVVIGSTAGACDEGSCIGASQEVGTETVTFNATAGQSYYFAVDGYDGASDSFSIEVSCGNQATYRYVAVRSRTATQADIDNNTPGPDIDGVEIARTASTLTADQYYAEDGEWGAADNANADPANSLDAPDAFNQDGTCNLADDASNDARFYSLGGGATALGAEGWVIYDFGDIALEDGDTISVYELSPADCSNIATNRDDEYEVYIGLSTVDPVTEPISALATDSWKSLGVTGTGGGITSFDVDLD